VIVADLMDEMMRNPAPITTVIPVVIYCPPAQEITQQTATNEQFTLMTLGGNHLCTAIKNLLDENEHDHLDVVRQVDVDVYMNLTLALASRKPSQYSGRNY
jgi:hypothetical protein